MDLIWQIPLGVFLSVLSYAVYRCIGESDDRGA